MKPWIKRSLLGLVGLVLLLLVTLYSAVFTQTGSRWLLQQVPGLSVEQFQGALLREWQAERVHWQDGETEAELTGVLLRFDSGCWWQAAICIEQLSVEQLSLTLPEEQGEATETESIELPEIHLPVDISIAQLQLGALRLNGEPLIDSLVLGARIQASELAIEQFSLGYQAYRLQTAGQLSMQGDWPLNIQLTAGGPLPELGEQGLELTLSGSLAKLVLEAELDGVFTGQLSGQAQPLQKQLPAQLALELQRLQLAELLPEGLQLEHVKLTLTGDLESAYQWRTTVQLLAQEQGFTLAGQGELTAESAQIGQLRLSHTDDAYAQLTGQVDWHSGLDAHAQLIVQQLPWQYLAGLDEAPVDVETATFELTYAQEQYHGHLQAELYGPGGKFQVKSELQGDATQLSVAPLLVTAGSGQLQGQAQVQWAEALQWQAELQLDDLNPGYWLADFPGTLAGKIHSSGHLGEQLTVTADAQLAGQLRGQPAQIALQLAGEGEHWQVPEMLFAIGDNRLQGQLQLDEALQGQFKLKAEQLAQLLPGASGTLNGQLDLSGQLQAPSARLELTGQRLAFAGQRIQTLSLKGQLDEGTRAELTLLADGLVSGEQALGRLSLSGQGDLAQHSLELALAGPLLTSELQLNGQFKEETQQWLGQLQRFNVEADAQSWQLQEPMTLEYAHEQHFRLGPHCLISDDGKLCGDAQQLLPTLQLDYRLERFGLAGLQPWLPDQTTVDGALTGQIDIKETPQGLLGRIELDAAQGKLNVAEEAFAWQQLRLSADLTPEQVAVQMRLQGATQGVLEMQLALDPRPEDKPLQGSFSLSQLDLSVLHPFVDGLEQLKGQVQGQGQIKGSLLAPWIEGDISLAQAQIGGGQLPTQLDDLQLTLHINGQQAQLKGGWRAGEQGQAQISGELDWRSDLSASVSVQGEHLPVHVQPYADLEVAPDLSINYTPAGLMVTGTIRVPKGKIDIPQLPEQAVTVSSDAVVVGREPEEMALPIGINIALDVGEERLRFNGFGLRADVRGKLQLADNLSGRGVLELLDGRYKAYGQDLQLRRARLVFSGPLTQPFIDIEAVRVTGNVTAGLRISGLAEQPQTEIFSQPAMAQEEALSWLLLGRPLSGGSDEGGMLGQAALALGIMGTAPVTHKIAETFGVQDFQLDSEGSGMSTSVVASGRLTERLSMRYGVGVFESVSTLALRYQLTERLYLEAASGLASSLDMFYRRNY